MTPALTKLRRAKPIDYVGNERAKEQARMKIAFVLKNQSGQKEKEKVMLVRKFPADYVVLVHQTSSKPEGVFSNLLALKERPPLFS